MQEELRTYIDILEYYSTAPVQVELLESDIVVENQQDRLHELLLDAVFKMRSYVEPTEGDYALGFEAGLEMAAGMIDNILKSIEGRESGS